MLAKETNEPFNDKNWLFEIKWDGYRAIAETGGKELKLYSRNGNSFVDSYPAISDALRALPFNGVIDGEIVVMDEDGHPSFQKLQHYADNSHYPILFYAFDLLKLEEKELYDLPLLERKNQLEALLADNEIIRYSDHVLEQGSSFFDVAKARNLEGIMAKKADSIYYPGKRTNEWLKIKHHNTEDAIIVGFTEPRGGRKYFGALVLGIMKDNTLTYAGHTGSGFDEKLLRFLHSKLQEIVQPESPFAEKVKTNMPVTWVTPYYVCEVKFTEWTNDGKMRHPIFLRLRDTNDCGAKRIWKR